MHVHVCAVYLSTCCGRVWTVGLNVLGRSGCAEELSDAQRSDLRNQPCSNPLPRASAKQDSA